WQPTLQPTPPAPTRAKISRRKARTNRGSMPLRPDHAIRRSRARRASRTRCQLRAWWQPACQSTAPAAGARDLRCSHPRAPRNNRARARAYRSGTAPTAHHHGKRIHVTDPYVTLQRMAQTGPLEDEEHAVPRPPQNERPACAMPQAAQQEHDNQIGVGAPRAALIAAKWNVEVIAKPVR